MNENICAISTSLGVGAISIVRCSGPDVVEIVNSIFKGKDLTKVDSHTIIYGHIVDNDEVTGYFSYSIDNLSNTLYNMGLLSFEKPNYHFIKAVTNHIKWLFDEKIIDRIEFFAYEDNPAIRGYDKIAERFGGKRVGKFTRSQRLYDGKLHNSIMYEILREDYENAKRGR